MAFGPERATMIRADARRAEIDVGLRSYMLRVYNYMSLGVALTGGIALYVASDPAMVQAGDLADDLGSSDGGVDILDLVVANNGSDSFSLMHVPQIQLRLGFGCGCVRQESSVGRDGDVPDRAIVSGE